MGFLTYISRHKYITSLHVKSIVTYPAQIQKKNLSNHDPLPHFYNLIALDLLKNNCCRFLAGL